MRTHGHNGVHCVQASARWQDASHMHTPAWQQQCSSHAYAPPLCPPIPAGRLQVDPVLMQELKDIKSAVVPTDVLLVVDAMTGQEAASLVKTFNDEVDITGGGGGGGSTGAGGALPGCVCELPLCARKWKAAVCSTGLPRGVEDRAGISGVLPCSGRTNLPPTTAVGAYHVEPPPACKPHTPSPYRTLTRPPTPSHSRTQSAAGHPLQAPS